MKKIETERKYVIIKPDMSILSAQPEFTRSEITQIYLADIDQTHRIRRRTKPCGTVEYTENFKRRISPMSVIESEEIISEERYEALKEMRDPKTATVEKTRVTFSHSGKVFEIDLYSEWERTCILEIELEKESESVDFPSFIRVVKDVTGMREYSNHAMSRSFPTELIEDGV